MKNYKFIDKSVYLEKEKILVIADLHLGYEQGLQEQGVFLPNTQYKSVIEELDKIFEEIKELNKKTIGNDGGVISKGNIINKQEKTHNKGVRSLVFNNNKEKVKEIIILGDLKHEFSQASSQEWREVLNLLEYLKNKAEKITIIKGNHDNYLINVMKNKENVKLVDYYIKNVGKEKICFLHGHKLFSECLDRGVKLIIMGHMHPAISIRKHAKEEKYKCFLVGKYKDTENCEFSVSQTSKQNKQEVCDKEIIILPSFFPLVEGADVNIEDTNLAIRLNLSGFEVYIPAGNKVLKFGKVKDVGRLV